MIGEYLSAIWTASAPAMANHLWQSTLFAVAAAVLTLALRKNQARVRYALWLAASIKFLIPFSLLISLGGHLAAPHRSASAQSGLYSMVEEIGQPFTRPVTSVVTTAARTTQATHHVPALPQVLAAAWLCGLVATVGLWWLRWRRLSGTIRDAVPVLQGREVDMLRQLEQIGGVRKPIPFLLSHDSLEPGIFGIVQPVLLWPAGISQHLQDAHLKAILTHEVWHVRRRDNLAAAFHMVVEAIFWFHPVVWWLGARLVVERERACDEEVLHLGSEPKVYAESILKACEFCVGPPLACVSGVTGADLKQRMVRIMTQHDAQKLDLRRKFLLAAIGVMAAAAPVAFGLMHPTESRADSPAGTTTATLPSFEVASIKPNKSAIRMTRFFFTPDGLSATNVTLEALIQMSYRVQDFQISGGPKWANSEHYDIEAKVDSSAVEELKKLSFEQRRLMVQSLLADRFKLALHSETKELPVYALVIGKSGLKLQEAKPGDTYPNGIHGPDGHAGGAGLMHMQRGQLTAQALPMEELTQLLSQQLGRTVLDKTGLTGKYDFTLKWTPEEIHAPMSKGPEGGGQGPDSPSQPDSSGPSIFTAIQEQLGLKLESQKGPVEVLVIDRAETPSEN